MRILNQKLSIQDIIKDSDHVFVDEMVKGVVDLKRQLVAVDAPMHADLERMLLKDGSEQYDLWGINLHLDDDLVEFDSMINIRPGQGNRSRSVQNPETQAQIIELVNQWVSE